MFYIKNEIDDILKCPGCNERIFEPNFLPCGESVCETCVLNLLEKNDSGISCPICSEFHEKPTNGFPKNKSMMKLLEKKYGEVYRNKEVELLKKHLKSIKLDTDDLMFDFSNPKDKIFEYCSDIRNKIQLITETKIEKIKQFSDLFMDIVKIYEKECLNKLDELNECKQEIDDMKLESDNFLSKYNDYLNNFGIKEEEVLRAISEARLLQSKLLNKRREIKLKTFNRKTLHFLEDVNTLEPSFLGKVFYKPINSDDEKFNFDKFKSIEFQNNTDKSTTISSIKTIKLFTKNQYIMEINSKHYPSICIYNHPTISLSKKNFSIESIYDSNSQKILFGLSVNRLLVYEENSYQKTLSHYMYTYANSNKLDYKFKKIREIDIRLDINLKKLACNYNFIFLLDSSCKLYLLDWKLVDLLFGVDENPCEPNNTLDKIVDFQVSMDRYFFLNDLNELDVYSMYKGAFLTRLKINQNNFIYDPKLNIITYDQNLNTIYNFFDLSGNPIEINLKNCDKKLSLIGVIDDSFFFFDFSTFTLYSN